MIDVLLFDSNKAELSALRNTAYSIAARVSDEDWNWNAFSDISKASALVRGGYTADFACLDVTVKNGIELASDVRTNGANSKIMILADASLSPMLYLRPSISPSSLLIKPFSESQATTSMREMLNEVMKSRNSEEQKGVFQLQLKSERKIIPYESIFFFEAREKKVFVNLGGTEYGFADTIDHLEEILPPGFVRCHRSFIAAKSRISNIFISKNYLEMENGAIIPLSRSYKPMLKELK